MLENDYSYLKLKFNIMLIANPSVIFGAIIWYVNKTRDEDVFLCASIIAVVGIALGGYLLLTCFTERKVLGNYLGCLKAKQFQDALYHGRMYYSIKRVGLKGSGGDGLTVYDEAAINNDISAYSKI